VRRDLMGWFFGKRRLSPEALRDALIDAAEVSDDGELKKLIAKQRDDIRAHFPSWTTVPEPIRADAAQRKRYVEGLIAVANHFKTVLDDPSLIARMTGPPAANPLIRWEQRLRMADEAMIAGKYREAEAALLEQMAAVRGMTGTGPDKFLPLTLGHIAQCRFHLGRAGEAVPLFWEALEICERTGDLEGQIAYLSNLHEAQRWLGETAEAAALADRLAARCEQAGKGERAAWVRHRAQRVRDGEPLVRVVLEADGKSFELDDLSSPLPAGPFKFQFERNRMSLGAVTALVEEGGRLGSQGNNAGALGAFRAAAAMDPSDPRPHYFAGLALMGLGRYPEAVESYEQTERLAPGWYHCRAGRALALELAARQITHATFESVRALEDGGKPATERAALAELALRTAPELAILYLLKANALIDMKSIVAAATAARAGLSRDPDPDVRTRLLVALARVTRQPESRRLLEEAIALDGNRVAAAMARVILLSQPVN
jgi:tetratricopeptide (TPR) repeat protein